MKQPKSIQNRNMALVMAGLVLLPVLITFIMWAVMPSGYQRFMDKTVTHKSVSTWQPLHAGLKQVVINICSQ
jgi:hypothetical protein